MDGIFISYRRGDSAGYAGRLHESLADRFGADRLFRDVDTRRPGQDFVEAIFDLPPTAMKTVLRATGLGQTENLPLEIR